MSKRSLVAYSISLVVGTALLTAVLTRALTPVLAVATPSPTTKLNDARVEPARQQDVQPQPAPTQVPERKLYRPLVWNPQPDSMVTEFSPYPYADATAQRIAARTWLPVPTLITWSDSRKSTSTNGATHEKSLFIRTSARVLALDECDPVEVAKNLCQGLIDDARDRGVVEGAARADVSLELLSPGGDIFRGKAAVDFTTDKTNWHGDFAG